MQQVMKPDETSQSTYGAIALGQPLRTQLSHTEAAVAASMRYLGRIKTSPESIPATAETASQLPVMSKLIKVHPSCPDSAGKRGNPISHHTGSMVLSQGIAIVWLVDNRLPT